MSSRPLPVFAEAFVPDAAGGARIGVLEVFLEKGPEQEGTTDLVREALGRLEAAGGMGAVRRQARNVLPQSGFFGMCEDIPELGRSLDRRSYVLRSVAARHLRSHTGVV